MKGIAITTLIFTIIGVVIAVVAIYVAKRLHKAVLRQNLEIEKKRIEIELKEIEVQIERAKAAGQEINSSVYGVVKSNPHIGEITALWDKRDALSQRLKEINDQLNSLK